MASLGVISYDRGRGSMARRRHEQRINLRVYSDEDPVLFAALEALEERNLRYGEKSHLLKEALCTGLGITPAVEEGGTSEAETSLKEAVIQALEESGLTLGAIRTVVEAGVESALARTGPVHPLPVPQERPLSGKRARLKERLRGMMLEEEDEGDGES
jgi:hypothetical protein